MVQPLNRSKLLELEPIEAAASRVRAAVGIEPGAPVSDAVAVLRQLGLVVAERDLGEEGLDGIYASEEHGGVIVLNISKDPYRVQRVAAHLLAHHVYGDEAHVDHDIDEPEGEGDPAQVRANAFASRLLTDA